MLTSTTNDFLYKTVSSDATVVNLAVSNSSHMFGQCSLLWDTESHKRVCFPILCMSGLEEHLCVIWVLNIQYSAPALS